MRKTLIAVTAALVTALAIAPAAGAIDKVNTKKLRKAVTVDGIMEHERALQDIAIANGGTRVAVSPGQDATVEYVMNRLKRAGYNAKKVPFDFPDWTLNGPSTLEETSPTARSYAVDTDFIEAQFSGSGDVTAQLVPTNDIEIPPSGGPGTGTSGCQASDFPAETAGNIALMQRGDCTFVQKFENAKAAGAAAAIIFNDGGEDREDPAFVSSTAGIGIPTVMVSNDIGESWIAEAANGPVTVHIAVDATTTPHTEYNVVANTPGGDKKRTIIVGGHLDSVAAGPGINDDGSGTSTILEMAEQISKLGLKPRNRIQFAFFGAEEAGLVGSTAYAQQLAENGQAENVEAMLDYDMLASENFVRFVYDGDNSTGEGTVGPPGSGEIEAMFNRYFRSQGLATEPTAFDGRSDYNEFILNGIPAGGIFTGAEGIKTEEQEAIFGGVAGLAYDPCYHQACDTLFNLSHQALDEQSDAATHAAWTLARSQSTVSQGSAAKKAKLARKAKRAQRAKPAQYRGHMRAR